MLFRAVLQLGVAATALASGLRPRDPTRQCGNPDDSGPAELDDDDDDDDGPNMGALRVGSANSSMPTPNVVTTGAAAAESIEVDLYFHIVSTSEDEDISVRSLTPISPSNNNNNQHGNEKEERKSN